MSRDSTPSAVTAVDVLEEGGRIVGLLLFWGLLAALARYGLGNVGFSRPGSLFFELGWSLAALFLAAGAASVLLFAVARGIQLAEA